jgi:hypothetical protein
VPLLGVAGGTKAAEGFAARIRSGAKEKVFMAVTEEKMKDIAC